MSARIGGSYQIPGALKKTENQHSLVIEAKEVQDKSCWGKAIVIPSPMTESALSDLVRICLVEVFYKSP